MAYPHILAEHHVFSNVLRRTLKAGLIILSGFSLLAGGRRYSLSNPRKRTERGTRVGIPPSPCGGLGPQAPILTLSSTLNIYMFSLWTPLAGTTLDVCP